MKRDYFEYNGERYNSGDTFYINWYTTYSSNPNIIKAKFLYYDTETKRYHFKPEYYSETSRPTELFFTLFRSKIYMTEQNKQNESYKATFKDELSIDGLLIAWVWYIFIMAVGIIFYDRWLIWIFASLIFFVYRNNKLKERGYK